MSDFDPDAYLKTNAQPAEAPALDTSTPVQEPTAAETADYGLGPNAVPGLKARLPRAAPAQPAAPSFDPDAYLKSNAEAPPADSISVYPNGPESQPLQVPATPEKADTYLAGAYSSWLAHNQETSPEKRVDVLRYSAATGIPAQMLEPHLDEVKRTLGTQNLAAALGRRPTLAKYLQDAARAPLVKDDAAALGGLEWYLGRWDLMPQKVSLGDSLINAALGPVGAVRQAAQLFERQPGAYQAALTDAAAQMVLTVPLETAHLLGQEKLYGLDDASASLVENILDRTLGDKDYGAKSWLNEHALSALKTVPYLAGSVALRTAGAVAGAAAGAETGPGAIGTGAAGEYAGAVAWDLFSQAGPTFHSLRGLEDGSGNPLLSEDEARTYALASAGASSLITGWLGGKVLRGLGADGLLGKVGGGAVARALTQRTVAQAAKSAALRLGTTAVEGALYSTVPAVATATAEELAKHEHGQAASVGNVALAGEHAFVQGFQDMLVLGTFGAGREFLGGMAEAHRLGLGAKQLEGQVAAARQSKLAERSPPEFERFAAMAQGDNPQTVYADTGAWDVYWQGQKLDPRELAAQLLKDNGKAYDEAKATGGRLSIPAEKYLSGLARTPHHEALRDDVALSPTAPTVNEGRRALERQAQQVADAGRAPDDGADKVAEEWRRMSLAAGDRPQVSEAVGQLAASAFRRLGEHFGWTAEEAYRKAGTFEIAGALGERLPEGLKPGGIEAGSRPAMRAAWLERNPDLQSRIGDYFRDELTGLYNERGYRALPPDPSRPIEARWEINGGKPINDFHGHDALDGGLRVAGQTLRDNGIPDGAKIGGDVHGRVQTVDRAKEIAGEMSKRLGVPVSVFTHEVGATPDQVKQAGEAYKAWKDEEVAAGRLGPRTGLPPGFMPADAPAIDFAAEKGKPAREGFLHHESPEAQAVLKEGAKGLGPIAEKMRQAPMLEPAAITAAHVSAFEKSLIEKDPFDTIHMDSDGALTGRGGKLAREVAPKEHQLSADIRDVGAMNKDEAFGKYATDQILSHVVSTIVQNGGAEHDLGRPHGDELDAQSNDRDRMEDVFHRSQEQLKKTAFLTLTKDVDGIVVQKGVHFAYAIGRRAEGESAEAALKRVDADLLPGAKAEQRDLAKPDRHPFLPAEPGESLASRARRTLEVVEQSLRGEGFATVRLQREARSVDQGGAGGDHNAPPGGSGGAGEGEGNPAGGGAQGAPGGAREAVGGGGSPQGAVGQGNAFLDQVAIEPSFLTEDFGPVDGHEPGADLEASPEHQDIPVAPGVTYGPQSGPPTVHALAEAEALISKKRAPDLKAAGEAFLGFVRDWAAGKEPKLPEAVSSLEPARWRRLELELADVGVFDPRGHETGEDLSHRSRGGKRGGPVGQEPAELKRARLARQMSADEYSALPYAAFEKKGRGYMTVSGPEGARRYRIRLLEDADATTLAHEFSHAFSHVLGDFATAPNAPESLRGEYASLVRWMGYDSPKQRQEELAQRLELTKKKDRTSADEARLHAITAKEEKLSHAFEQYLAEGKTPSAHLARVFQRFRNWVLKAYKVASGPAAQYLGEFGRKLEFSDDARRMFDRWFAADTAVTAATPTDAFAELRAKMTPEERAKDDELAAQAREHAVTEVVRRVAEAQHEEVSGFIGREREQIREEVKKQLEGKGVYAVLRFLQDGDTVATPGEAPELLRGEGGQPMKLSRAEAVKVLGVDVVKTLPRGIFASKGDDAHSMSADGLADAFDFASGKQLLEAIRDSLPRQQAVEAETQRRMEERFGPELLADPARLAEVAAQAVNNEADLRRTFHAIEALRRQMGARGAPLLTPETAAALAAKYVDAKTVGELTRGEKGLPDTYRRNAETAARRGAEAFRKGNTHRAEAEYSMHLLNLAMARRATDLRAEMEKGRAKLEQLSKKASREAMFRADPAFLSASEAVLQALGLAKPQEGVEPPSIEPLVALAGENLQGLFAFDADLMRRLVVEKTPWKKLSVSEARAVVEALSNIRHVAGQTNFLDLVDKQMAADEFFAKLEEEVKGTGRKPVAPEDYNEHAPRTRKEKAAKALKGFKADLTEMGNIVAKLGPRDGVAQRLFVDARRAARDKEVALKKSILKAVGEKYEKLPKELQRGADDEVPVKLPLPPDPDRPLGFKPTRKWLWSLALNWGNEGNRQRLRDGNGWTDEQVQEALNLLTPAEGEYLQGILDTTNGLFPELAKVRQQRTGLPLPKVAATPFRIGDKEFAGGYMPLKYDIRFAGDVARRQVAGEIDRILPNDYRSPISNGSYTHSRAEKVESPVRISWDTVPAHLAQVAHDIAYGDWVRQVAGLLNDKQGRFDKLLNTYLGPELAAQFRPWLADVARDKADSLAGATAPFWEGASGKLRRFAAMGSTMFNVQSYARHLFDPFAAVSKVKGVPLWRIADAYRQAVADWGARRLGRPGDEYRGALYQQSQVLRYREASHEDGIRQVFADAGVKTGLSGWMVKTDAHLRAGISTVVDQSIFLASYKHALSQGMAPEEATRWADDVVTDTTPSFDVAERPALLRSKRSIAGAVMLMGYRSKMFNLHERAWSESAAKGAATTLQLIAIGAAGSLFVHLGKRDDEDWTRFGWEQSLEETFGLIPLAGDIAVAMLQGKNIDASRLPEARAASEVGDALTRLVTKWGDGEDGADKAWEALQLYLALSGGPLVAANQVKKVGQRLTQ